MLEFRHVLHVYLPPITILLSHLNVSEGLSGVAFSAVRARALACFPSKTLLSAHRHDGHERAFSGGGLDVTYPSWLG